MWRTSLSIVLTLALTLSTAQPSFARDLIKSLQVESQVYQQVVQAESLMGSKNYAGARDVLLRAAQQDPTSYSKNIHRDLMQCYVSLGQYEAVVSEGRRLLLMDPSDGYATEVIRNAGSYGYLSKGQEAMAAGKYAEAKRWLQKAAQFDPSPNSAYIHSSLCYVLQQLGEPAAAIEEGKRALALSPGDADTTYTLATAYSDNLQFDQALTWMHRYLSLERDPNRRQQVQTSMAAIEDDAKQLQNPNNKKADYFEVMRESADDAVRWNQKRFPLKVAIGSGSGVKGHRPAFNNLVKIALDSWCQASGKRLDYKVVGDASDADIVVKWTKEPLEISLNHPNVQPCGLTNWDSDGEKHITSAVVQIRTVDPFHPNEVVTDAECAHIVLHEIGHALGIGHSKYIRDVMYFRAAPQQQALTGRDKATIARLYGEYPVIGFVPKQQETAGAPPVPVAPPAFLPPAVPDDSKVKPPMFVPPPVTGDDKLTPPMFVPPSADQPAKPSVPVPMFVPQGVTKQKPPSSKKVNVPFFVPPGAK